MISAIFRHPLIGTKVWKKAGFQKVCNIFSPCGVLFCRTLNIYEMENRQAPAIVAGTDFSLLVVALRDEAPLPQTGGPQAAQGSGAGGPAEAGDQPPAEWLEDLTDFDITLQLSSASGGGAAVATTVEGGGNVAARRIDPYHIVVDVPAAVTAEMNEGELVITVTLCHRPTGAVQKAERKLQRIIKVREAQI